MAHLLLFNTPVWAGLRCHHQRAAQGGTGRRPSALPLKQPAKPAEGQRSAERFSRKGQALSDGLLGLKSHPKQPLSLLLCYASLSIGCKGSTGCWIPLLEAGDRDTIQVLPSSASTPGYPAVWEHHHKKGVQLHFLPFSQSAGPHAFLLPIVTQTRWRRWSSPDTPVLAYRWVSPLHTSVCLDLSPQGRHQLLFFMFLSLDLGQLSRGQIHQTESKLQEKKMSCISTFSSGRVTI